MENTEQLTHSYRNVCESVAAHCKKYQRSRDSITLIAVSKRHPAWKVVELARLGHQDFAENYLQEALEKISGVNKQCQEQSITTRLNWHFIGHIQSRKCRDIAENFDWVHTIESEKTANKLNHYRSGLTPLNVLIQVNLQHEPTKSGINPDKLESLANHINSQENLKLRGLMLIPKYQSDFRAQRHVFQYCRELQEKLNKTDFQLDHLSMGMSSDLEAAIAEGTTQIRIGTAIFGKRPEK